MKQAAERHVQASTRSDYKTHRKGIPIWRWPVPSHSVDESDRCRRTRFLVRTARMCARPGVSQETFVGVAPHRTRPYDAAGASGYA